MLPDEDPRRPVESDPVTDRHLWPPPTGLAPEPEPGEGAAASVPIGPITMGPRPQPRAAIVAVAMLVIAVLAGGALFLGGFTLGQRAATQPGTPANDEQLFEPFWNTYQAIVNRYAGGDVDRQKLVEGAIRGLFEALGDPYSSYLSPDEFRQTLQGISGEFEGIGAEIGPVDSGGQASDCATLGADCHLSVIAPIEGSPAEKAGLRPGDIVDAVDGTSLNGLTIDEARDRIRGKKGTEVVLTIIRDGGEPMDIAITRDTIQQREVIERDLAEGAVGYLRLTGFSENGADRLHDEIVEDVDAGRKQLILDLRGNPGGFVTAARQVASEFIAEGQPIFWQEDAAGVKTVTNAGAGGAATSPDIRIVLLVDRGSASASEIVAGALKDSGRATLVGETTFGKGTVQEWTPLEGAGGFRLTTAKWLTPNQTWIHRVGVVPDVPVEVPADNPAGEDPVLDAALELLAEEAVLDRAA
jgi:carboxyl-terminal processing protease